MRNKSSDERENPVRRPNPYEIVIEGHLASQRLHQFRDLSVIHRPSGETVIVGHFPDQSALLGLLNWIHDLGVVLVLVKQLHGDCRGLA